MASDSSEPTRRKHHRSSSPDDAEERSKRRKHRHHRSHRHHHRSKKDKGETRDKSTSSEVESVEGGSETGREEARLENNGKVLVSNTGLGLDGVDYDMEEGEIVDDGVVADKLKNLDSDVESGEIKPNAFAGDSNMGVNNDDFVERVDVKSLKLEKDIIDGKETGDRNLDLERASDSQGPANRNHLDDDNIPRPKYKRTSDSDNDVERKSQMKSFTLETRSNTISGPKSHDKFLKESSHRRSRSPERSGRRSQSRSILQENSTMGTPRRMDRYNMKKEHRSESGDERMIDNGRSYRHSSRGYSRDKERERSSSRYAERTERYYGRDSHDKYRESSRDRDRERDRIREKSRERDRERDRESSRLPDRDSSRLPDRDRSERDRDRGLLKENPKGRKRERENDRERENRRDRDRHEVRTERNPERDRVRDGVGEGARARSRDIERDRDNVNDRFSRRQKYGTDDASGNRERENSSSQRRYSENHRDRSTRTDKENLSSKDDAMERVSENEERKEAEQEDFQERISMQLAEQEEDDLERIKEESRRRRQAILEKYKNKQKIETQSQDKIEEKIAASSEQLPGVEVNIQTDSQRDGAYSNVAESSFDVGKLPSQNGLPDLERCAGAGGLGEGTPKSEISDDMFRDDIFGESPAGVRKIGKEGAVAIERSGLNDNWDDAEGYYGYRFGEILDGRYEIIAAHGKGVFSSVVRAKDLKAKAGQPEEVAIKIIRNNETMYKAGMDELIILNKLVGADPDNKRHCVRYLSNFKYRNHLCLVFESLHMNLREVLKKFGRNIGLNLTGVRTYAKQLFIALKHLKNCGVLHCDIKPDNMLVNEAKNVLKLCDFGNAMFSGQNEITPYLVSRFYRAPEIILGLPYDHPMDIWSVGCCLFELYTGKVLFPGPTNNDMLRLHMELKGPFPKKMLRKGAFTDQHFDQDLNFLAMEEDTVTKKVIRRLTVNIKPNDFGSLISGSSGEDPKMTSNFKDLMDKIFVLDPDKRLTVSQALSHPFITGK